MDNFLKDLRHVLDIQVHALGGIEKLHQQPLSPIPHPEENLPNLVDFGHGLPQQLQDRHPIDMQRLSGDHVRLYSEVAAAHGALGRFTGGAIMPLVRQFLGR